MFRIDSVHLNNFKSYAGEHHFKLPTEPGLYFLTGSNEREPKLGSNGSGKSTLLDGIYWCLYGRTLRGLKASDIITWGQSTCTVEVWLKVAGELIGVRRDQSPNKLTLHLANGSNPVEQNTVEKYIGLNAEAFVYSVILPQFGQSFFELKPAEKLTLFSDIMNLDFWLERSNKAAEAVKAISAKTDRIVIEIETSKEWQTRTAAEIEDLKSKAELFETITDEEIKGLTHQCTELAHSIADVDRRKKKLNESLTFWEKDKARREAELKQLATTKDRYETRHHKFRTEIEVLKSIISERRGIIDRLSEVGAECPTCLQIVDPKHLKKERHKLVTEINDRKATLHNLDKQMAENHRFLSKATKDVGIFAEGIGDLIVECGEIRTKLAALTEREENYIAQIRMLKKQRLAKSDEKNPYKDLLSEHKNKLSELDKKLMADNQQLAILNADYEATSYWVNGFKRIRLFVIEETLRTLELEVNNSLASLGLIDWQVEFDIERENKSGGITKGFTVFIRCPSHPEPVRWESWSGGETQRLQLAGDFGLANLIMQQAGLSNTIEFYDEPSDHLSDEGLVDLAETLQHRAITNKKCILLVDHRMPDFGEFAGIFKVIKDDEGSHIQEE